MLAPLAAALMLPAVVALLWAKRRERVGLEMVTKPIASGLFLVAAAAEPAGDSRYAAWILGGLACSFVGDQLLIGKGKWWVGPGLVAFLCAHACYLVAVLPRSHAASSVAVALPLLLAGGWVLSDAWPELGRLRGPAVVYLLVLSALSGAAVSVWIAGAPGGALVGLGMLLFFLSDLSVARYRFVKPAFATKVWGVPCYYAAQLLLAFSIGSVGAGGA